MNDFFSQTTPELAEDARRLLLEIDRAAPGATLAAGNCRPPLDILERADSLEIVMDVPGVPADALRVAVRGTTLLIVGRKPTGAVEPQARFHLAERSYGHFVRAVRLDGAFDASDAKASVAGGQLRVVLPVLSDRRGRIFSIPVERG